MAGSLGSRKGRGSRSGRGDSARRPSAVPTPAAPPRCPRRERALPHPGPAPPPAALASPPRAGSARQLPPRAPGPSPRRDRTRPSGTARSRECVRAGRPAEARPLCVSPRSSVPVGARSGPGPCAVPGARGRARTEAVTFSRRRGSGPQFIPRYQQVTRASCLRECTFRVCWGEGEN